MYIFVFCLFFFIPYETIKEKVFFSDFKTNIYENSFILFFEVVHP